MDMNVFFGKRGFLCSENAEIGSTHLLDKLERGELLMDILPNRYPRFAGDLEEKDYVSYCHFLNSSNGKKVLDMLEKEDAGDFVEL